MSSVSVLSCQNVTKQFEEAGKSLQVLSSINFSVAPGECVAILGDSGSGKTTLLQLLALLDTPSSGGVFLGSVDSATLSDAERCQRRNRYLGFIYQFHHLLPELTAVENVMMPLLLGGEKVCLAKDAAFIMLNRLGLERQARQKVTALSGGERQRVAVARALVHKPRCVLADEPTGNLDAHSAATVLDLMGELQQQLATSFVIVTHDPNVAKRAHRVLYLSEGQLTGGDA